MSTQGTLELGHLSESYEIVGELSGRSGVRTYMARRRENASDVIITVFLSPQNDKGNALSHLAADVNLLAGQRHRALLPVVEGQWVGNDAFAIVSERPTWPSLAELIARREEAFDYTRIAQVLQEVNGLLEWARRLKVVHRSLVPDAIFVEPGSDRVQASFSVRALPLADVPGPEEDARTIAALARQMLTRSSADPERANQPLAELRPGLPKKVVEQTEALLSATRTSTTIPDVRGYIAMLAMSEALKRGETEFASTIQKMLEEERKAREEIEARRQACEATAAEQQRAIAKAREEFDKEKAQILRSFEKEREDFEKEKANMLRALEKERGDFEKEKASMVRSLEKERGEFEKEKANILRSLEKDREKFTKEKAEILRTLAKERGELDSERAALAAQVEELKERRKEIEAQGTLYATTAEFNTPVSKPMPVVVPVASPPRRWKLPRVGLPRLPRPSVPRLSLPKWRRAWALPAGAVALLLLMTVSVLALRGEDGPAPEQQTGGVTVSRVVESAGGVLVDTARPSSVTPAVPADFVSGVSARAALAPPVPVERRRRPAAVAPPDTFPPTATMIADTTAPADTTGRAVPPVRLDSVPRPTPMITPAPALRDSLRRDTLGQRDTVARRDGIRRDTVRPRDTLARRDTSGTP